MAALATYLLTTILLPAAVSAAVVAAITRSAIGRTPGFAHAAAGTACAVAMLWAFVMEVDATAVLRQLPVQIPADDGPFERWHRVGLVALVTAMAAPTSALLARLRVPGPRTAGAVAMIAVAALVPATVSFPGDTGFDRILCGLSILVSAAALAASPPTVAFVSAAATAFTIGGVSAIGGFVSLGVVAVTLALTALGLAIAGRSKERWAPALVLSVLLATLAACGHAYRDESAAAWPWRAAMAIPLLAWAAARALPMSAKRATS